MRKDLFVDNGVFEWFSLWCVSDEEFVSVCVSGGHSTESSCEVNRQVIHLYLCLLLSSLQLCSPHILWLTKLYSVSAVELQAAAQEFKLSLLHQISVIDTRGSVKNKL